MSLVLRVLTALLQQRSEHMYFFSFLFCFLRVCGSLRKKKIVLRPWRKRQGSALNVIVLEEMYLFSFLGCAVTNQSMQCVKPHATSAPTS